MERGASYVKALVFNLFFKGQVGRLLSLQRMMDLVFYRTLDGWLFKGNGKKKLTDIGFWFFCWILDLLQKLTERFSRISVAGFSIGIGLD